MQVSQPLDFTVGLSLRALLYGIYITTLLHSIRWVAYEDEGWKLRKHVNWLTITTIVVVFLLTTADLGISCHISLVAVRNGRYPFDRLMFIANNIEKIIVLIGDAVLVYRCWMTYLKSWRIIYFPLILLFCNIAFIIMDSYASMLVVSHSSAAWLAQRSDFLVAFYSTNIVINVYATSTIIYRIINVTRSGSRNSGLYTTSRILAESGSLYTLSTIFVLFTTTLGKGTVLYSISCAVSGTMTGIAFNLVLIRVRQHQANEPHLQASGGNTNGAKPMSELQFDNFHATTKDLSYDLSTP